MPEALDAVNPELSAPVIDIRRSRSWRDFPYWLVAIIGVIAWMAYLIATQDRYNIAYDRIIRGLRLTVETTVYAFILAVVLGLIAGLGRIARNVVARNVAIFYIEFIRGVPILVLIFTVAFVVVPEGTEFFDLENSTVSLQWRAIIALALIYGAYLGEVFRAGIESVPTGQTEAGRSLGMSHRQTMRRIVLPQAVRNMTPALGNDAIAMLKDTSLISVLAVRDLTQHARLYAGTSFDFRATYLVLVACYLTLTLTLSLLLAWYRRRLGLHSGI
ncbi:MAG TPA: amino acid ABC transporter permease [Acidimicrobiia bacterium]|nr:amino acid ABC transporter permease [Acidimicrobiia bacterium]